MRLMELRSPENRGRFVATEERSSMSRISGGCRGGEAPLTVRRTMARTMRRLASLVAAVGAAMTMASPAGAQSDDVARAEELFREAKRLIDQRRYDEACPKLAESQRLDPAGGTALTLALCHQAAGRLATATRAFETALEFAGRDGRADRAKVARAAVAKLTPLLSRLVVRVDAQSAALSDLRVERDGDVVERGAFDVAVPVDGGEHTIVASAPGHRRYATADMGCRAW